MIRRSFLQTIIAALVAPLAVIRAKEPVVDSSFSGTMTAKDDSPGYIMPAYIHLVGGEIIKAELYGKKFSYCQPHKRWTDLGSSKVYYQALGLELRADFMRIDNVDHEIGNKLANSTGIEKIVVSYIEFQSNSIAIDNEHASNRISMMPLPSTNMVSTKMALDMTLRRPTIDIMSRKKEGKAGIYSDVVFHSRFV